MDIKHQSLVLDINETRNYTLIKACQGDQKSRYIDCTLTQNGSVLSLTSNYRAIVKASINNEVKAINSCTIDTTSQVIVVELTSVMLDTPGVLNCEITVQDGQQIVTSQAFAVQVRQSTVANETEIKKSKEYGALVDALNSIADVESKADKVQGLVDNIDRLESADRLKHLAEHGRFNFSATFTSDGVIKKTTSASILQSGDFATGQNDIGTAYVSNAVTKIGSGTFSNCTSLTTIYVDNKRSKNIVPDTAKDSKTRVIYSDDDNFLSVNELLASAIKSLKKQVNADKSDWENRATSIETQHKTDVQALTDKANSIVEQANTDRQNFNKSVDEINTKLETPLADIESLKADKLDKADFNSYKTATDKAFASNLTLINQNAIKVATDKSTSIVLNDSSDCNIVDLKLYNTQANLYMCGKNLADFNTYFAKAQAWTTTGSTGSTVITRDTINKTISFNSINSTGRSGINVGWNNSGVPISLLLGKTITISVDVSSTDDCKFFLCNSCDNYKKIYVNTTANKVSRVALTTKMPSDVSSIKDTSILLHVDSSMTTVTLSNFQIELSSTATDYENYKESQTVTNTTDMSTVHTYYPTTTIISDSDFEVTYIADPKNYIDNKILEVATALVASESEVM